MIEIQGLLNKTIQLHKLWVCNSWPIFYRKSLLKTEILCKLSQIDVNLNYENGTIVEQAQGELWWRVVSKIRANPSEGVSPDFHWQKSLSTVGCNSFPNHHTYPFCKTTRGTQRLFRCSHCKNSQKLHANLCYKFANMQFCEFFPMATSK